MEERFINILNLLTSKASQFEMMMRFSSSVVTGFEEHGRTDRLYKYKLETGIGTVVPDSEHRPATTFLTFYLPQEGDNIFSAGIEHYFGRLDATGLDDYTSVEMLCQLLLKNDPAFLLTGGYLSLSLRDNNAIFASVNCMLPFVDELSDEQVAKTLAYQLAWTFNGLESWDDSITILKRF